MRLWHEKLLPLLPNQQIRGQHSECCGMRGLFWGRKHKIVDYAFKHSLRDLELFHMKVMAEMKKRGMYVADEWLHTGYRGKKIESVSGDYIPLVDYQIYPEHDDAYLKECLDNLAGKGIVINL